MPDRAELKTLRTKTRLKQVLFIGSSSAVQQAKENCEADTPTELAMVARFSELSAQSIRALNPDLVVSNLIARDFDMLDVARMLFVAGFQGRYAVHCGDISNLSPIYDDLERECPGLDVKLITNAELEED